MRPLRIAIVAIGLLCAMVSPVRPAAAAGTECTGSAALSTASAGCVRSAEDIASNILTSGSKVSYSFEFYCEDGVGVPNCAEAGCTTADGRRGVPYRMYRNGVYVGIVCLAAGEAEMLETADPGLVLREFQRLSWPESSIVIQPPDGETLVNFETNLLTTNTEPTQQTVTLLGLPITIEATPSTYTWIHGDGTEQTTSSPGDFYPAGDVFHEYLTAQTVSPSIDTTYSGRFRIRDSDWYDIPATVTVVGPSVPLTVREARPQLTGAD